MRNDQGMEGRTRQSQRCEVACRCHLRAPQQLAIYVFFSNVTAKITEKSKIMKGLVTSLMISFKTSKGRSSSCRDFLDSVWFEGVPLEVSEPGVFLRVVLEWLESS